MGELTEAFAPGWWTWVRPIVAKAPEVDDRADLLGIGDLYSRGEMDRDEFLLELTRVSARAVLRQGPVLRGFPSGDGDALDYAVGRRTCDEARRSRRGQGPAPAGGEMTKPERSQLMGGRQAYRLWYDPVVDSFDTLARLIRDLPPGDQATIDKLLEQGNRLHAFYAKQVADGTIPWLPPHCGRRYSTVLRAWEALALRIGGPQ